MKLGLVAGLIWSAVVVTTTLGWFVLFYAHKAQANEGSCLHHCVSASTVERWGIVVAVLVVLWLLSGLVALIASARRR